MPNTYAPIPKFDQTVEYITQSEPIIQKDGSAFCDVKINPVILNSKSIDTPKTIDVLVIGLENVIRLGREVSQKNVDALKTAIVDNEISTASASAFVSRLDSIKATPVIISEPVEPLQDEPVIKLP